MYEAFYGLNEKPFNLTPDPRFLYLSSKHKEAFAHLLYGIRNRSGFVMVSGEIGTGKTTICRSLLKQLDPDTEVAFIFNPKLSPSELLRTINSDFGIASKADSIRGLVEELNAHLLDRAGKGKNCVLIIDEAQNLGTETLEQVRLLSNLETETEKLLQIVLIGQPELAEKLRLNELRQLNQRITARYHLGSLSRDETLHYIAFRLRVAGGQKKVRFTRSAVRLVHRISRGTPRVINALCDRALLIGYTKETRTITPAIIRKSAREVQGETVRPKRRFRLLPASAAAVAVLAVFAALFARGDISLPMARPIPDATARVARSAPETGVGGQIASYESSLEREASLPVAPAADPTRGIAEAAILPIADATGLTSEPGQATGPSAGPLASVSGAAPTAESDAANGDAAGDVDELDVDPAILDKLASVPGGAETSGMRIVETSPAVHAGLEALVRAWGLDVKQVPPVTVTPETARRFGSANGLRVVTLYPSIDQLVALNLPALLRMRDAEWVALTRIEAGQAHLVGRDGASAQVEIDALGETYDNEAIYFWRDPAAAAGILRASMRGGHVEDLQEELRELGLLEREPSGVYDAATIDTVTKIQRTAGLGADGIAGPQTRMVLVSWLGRPGTPRLSDSGFTDRMRERVLARQGIVTATAPEPAPPPVAPEPQAAPVPDVIEPEMDLAPVPAPEDAEPETVPAPEAPVDTYTPILPQSPPADSPAITPSASSASPIRPAGRESVLQ